MLKKLLALALAVIMVMSMVACNVETPAGTTAPTGSQPTEAAPKDPVTITFHYLNGVGEQQYTNDVEDKLNEIMQAIPGYEHITLDLVPHGWSYATDISLAQANNEQIDILNTFNLSYNKMVVDGDFMKLDDLLAKYPGVASDVPEWLIDYGRFDGDLYYIPTYQQAQSPAFFYAPVEYFEYYYEKSGKDDDYIRSVLNSGEPLKILDFAEEFYLAVVEGTGLTTKKMFGAWSPWHFYNKDDIALDGSYVGVTMKEGGKPVYWPLTEEFHDVYAKLNEWYKKGYTNDPTVKNSYKFKTDDNSVVFGIGTNAQSEEAYGKAQSTADNGECKAIRITDHCYIEGTWAAGGNAISADCENPEEAMMIIELLMSDNFGTEFYNTLIWGLEYIHYNWVNKGKERIKTLEFDGTQGGADTTYCAWNWNTGNIFNGWLNQSSPSDDHYKFIEDEIHNSPKTVTSPFIGFTWHLEDVADERAQCKAVNGEYFGSLYAATDFEARYQEYVDKLKAAGVDKIMETVNAQYEEAMKK